MSTRSAFTIAVGAIGAAAALAAGAVILWFALGGGSSVRQDQGSADSSPAPTTEEAVQPGDWAVTTPPLSIPPSTMQISATSSDLVHDPARTGTAYLDANDEVQGLLNSLRTGRIVVRSRVVEVDKEYAARLIRGVVRDIDALGGTFVGALSETFDIAMFPDTPCTFSYVSSGFRRPRVRSIETSPGVFSIVEDAAGGEVLRLDSHCGSSNEVTSARVGIDTFEETVRIELANDRVVQQLISLETEGFMVAVEFDAKSFPSNEQTDVVLQ